MTVVLSGTDIAKKLADRFPDAVIETDANAAVIKSESWLETAAFFKNDPDMSFDLLVDITSVDYWDYFEVVYRLTSLKFNNSLVLKVRCHEREKPSVPSLTGLWKGANLMEREVYDLMGITFSGHLDMKRVFLWEGFTGHPLRKDYL
ncbi:MAG: NADH-quinone oxidoreductase subunit C [Dehalococcoidales bacterium]|nr:NADH-quinone oxidoreductase subunit C [Dehalococcoidales bacterium]